MSLKDLITTGITADPPRIVLYGIEGIGKSSFGASAASPIFIPTEKGLGEITAPKFPKPQSFEDVMDYLRHLYNEQHDYKTVVVDTLDWLEPLVWQATCDLHGQPDIEGKDKGSPFGFAKGYHFALDVWGKFLQALDYLCEQKRMSIILIAHADIKRFDSPDVESYDRYGLKLNAKAAAKIREWADAVIFVNQVIYTEKTDVGFNKKVVRGIGGHSRMMYTDNRPAAYAKNRYGLPSELPFNKGEAWNTLVTAIKAGREVATQTQKGE